MSDSRELDPNIQKCITEMVEVGEFSEGEGCDECGYCAEYDVRGPSGFGKIGTAKYCKQGLWQDET
jgi:hypothetical protein